MIDFPAIAAAALAASETLVPQWLPAGRRNGHEWLCGDLLGNPGESTSINLQTGKWADFAGDARGGDLISLYAAIHGCDQAKAAVELGKIVGITETPAAPPKRKGQNWTQVIPAPDHVPPPTLYHSHYKEPEGRWCYHDAEGRVIGWIARFRKSEGGKEVMPCTWARSIETGEEAWKWLSFLKPRPLYGLRLLAAKPESRVSIVEGEKCADALRAMGALAVTWPGGSNAVRQVDWSPLTGRKVTIWPDADAPGIKAAREIAVTLHGMGCEVRIITPPEGKADGWDCADAIAEGWTKEQIGQLFTEATIYTPAPTPEKSKPLREAVADESDRPFEFLGYDLGRFFYLSHGSRQIVDLTARQHAKNDLLQLAPLEYWMTSYPGNEQSGGVNWLYAANSLIQESHARGIYDPSLIRGRGAWLDEGRVIFHAGDGLHVDGERVAIQRFRSRFIYQRGRMIDLPKIEPASAKQGAQLVTLLRGTNLRHHMDPILMAGWLVCAPICGALEWRPGIWLSGAAGTGKSWMLSNIITPLLGDAAILTNCTSTSEPGIRQTLRHDAFPVVIDEAETESKADQERIQRILMLQRQASRESRARILKGSASGEAMDFMIRSMFLWASIGVAAIQRADLSRNVLMELVPGRHPHNPDQFRDLKEFAAETTSRAEWCAAIRARALMLAPVIAANASTFATACVGHLGSQRDGDQIGTLLAGAYALTSDARITLEDAKEWCARQDWSEHMPSETDMDEQRCLAHLMAAHIELEEHGHRMRRSVGELVSQALNHTGTDVERKAAKISLERFGIGIRRDGVDVSNSHQELRRIYSDTPFAAKWADQFKRLPEAKALRASQFHGAMTRAVRLPFELFRSARED